MIYAIIEVTYSLFFSMAKIVTTSQLQKAIGSLLSVVGKSWLVVTNKGNPRVVMLPYFDDNEGAIAEYMEEYEMNRQRVLLQERYARSKKSGCSHLAV